MGRRHRRLAPFVVTLAVATACGGAAGTPVALDREVAVPTTGAPPPTDPPPEATTVPPGPPTTAAATSTSVPPLPPPTIPRTVHEQGWVPFAVVGDVVGEVTLHHPSARVERIGFHESGHDGARELVPLATAADALTLETRDRGTGAHTAADVVVDPDVEIRAPVTGRVLRAGGYVLYCDHRDDFAVMEPDARPGWEVKVLHINGVQVRAGDRVVAGETVLAPRPTQLPFESQVDEFTAEPSWPHVHIEVVDPTIPDRPSGPGC